jgi:phage terminase large subunit
VAAATKLATDYKNPDYSAILAARARKLDRIRQEPKFLEACKVHYRANPWDFVGDWGMTFEPRNIERGLIAAIPFVPWPKQMEFLRWLHWMWKSQERGLVEKSRDCGITWLCVGFAAAMWMFTPGFTVGFGSRKEDFVDKRGDMDSIFEKLRFFVDNVPNEFRPRGFTERLHSAHMRLINPESGAAVTGEAGDQIGRGGRKSVYLVDESAFIENQKAVDKALSQNTNCQIDISTPNGSGNEFYKKRQRWDKTSKVFVFDWRDDPRKDEAWYQKMREDFDEVIVAQEIDRDYEASNEDAFIPAKWVKACIDAHIKLGFEPSGIRVSSFDPADVGDAKALTHRHGSVFLEADQKKDGDITHAIPWAAHSADQFRADIFTYDADGMGAPVIKLTADTIFAKRIKLLAFNGGGGVHLPDAIYGKGSKKNKDTFVNYRAQAWTRARELVKATHDAIERASKGLVVNVDPEKLISISSKCKFRDQLVTELSRPKRLFQSNTGKIKVESKVDMKKREVESPNLGDSFVMNVCAMRSPRESSGPINAAEHVVYDTGMSY